MIRWTRRAEKDLDGLPEKTQDQAKEVLEHIDSNEAHGKKLKGALAGKYSVRLGRSHRILYEFADADVIVLTIAPRRDVYR